MYELGGAAGGCRCRYRWEELRDRRQAGCEQIDTNGISARLLPTSARREGQVRVHRPPLIQAGLLSILVGPALFSSSFLPTTNPPRRAHRAPYSAIQFLLGSRSRRMSFFSRKKHNPPPQAAQVAVVQSPSAALAQLQQPPNPQGPAKQLAKESSYER